MQCGCYAANRYRCGWHTGGRLDIAYTNNVAYTIFGARSYTTDCTRPLQATIAESIGNLKMNNKCLDGRYAFAIYRISYRNILDCIG